MAPPPLPCLHYLPLYAVKFVCQLTSGDCAQVRLCEINGICSIGADVVNMGADHMTFPKVNPQVMGVGRQWLFFFRRSNGCRIFLSQEIKKKHFTLSMLL
jgi:hypothetical protein